MTRILLAEDDADTAGLIAGGLGEAGYTVVCLTDGQAALEMGKLDQPDLVILDRMLPGLDGLSVLKRLREAGVAAPALMLTALGRIEDRVAGLDAGADDYLVKPFAFSELAARVNALLRRTADNGAQTSLGVGSICIDLLDRTVHRDGRPVALQPREFRLLEELARNAGKVVTRTMLLERVWGFHFDPQTNIVETHMSRMRAKLNDGFDEDPVQTIRGEGYRMRTDC